MTTSFEYLPRSSRRVHQGWTAPAIFLATALAFGGTAWWLRGAAQRLQETYSSEAAAIDRRTAELASQTAALLPDPGPLIDLRRRVIRHNTALIGPRTPWTRIFTVLEEVMPADAVLARIERASTGRPEFPGGAVDLRLKVVVGSLQTANQLYLRMSADPRFDGLGFTPKGELVHLGRPGIGIDVTFRFREGA